MAEAKKQSLDDVMLAMDVVDTLRHRARLVEKELGAEDRREDLINRLREIYTAQGIEVPDHILADGVQALEEKRFVYEPPADSLNVRLARIYIARDRWLKPLIIAVCLIAAGFLAYEFAYKRPLEAQHAQEQLRYTETIPGDLEALRDRGLELAADDDIKRRIDSIYQSGLSAAKDQNDTRIAQVKRQLQEINADLGTEYTVRIVSRPGEYSGVFRIPDNNPDSRNYYIIVEAVDSMGSPVYVTITSEEDQKTDRVTKWGIRVPASVFNDVAADKQDDQIIQNADIGAKPRGLLKPSYTIPVSGGAILEW